MGCDLQKCKAEIENERFQVFDKGVQNFLNQTPQGVGGGLCLGTFQKKMKSGVSGAGGMLC